MDSYAKKYNDNKYYKNKTNKFVLVINLKILTTCKLSLPNCLTELWKVSEIQAFVFVFCFNHA